MLESQHVLLSNFFSDEKKMRKEIFIAYSIGISIIDKAVPRIDGWYIQISEIDVNKATTGAKLHLQTEATIQSLAAVNERTLM